MAFAAGYYGNDELQNKEGMFSSLDSILLFIDLSFTITTGPGIKKARKLIMRSKRGSERAAMHRAQSL